MTDFNFAFPIDMIKREQRIVVGIATADNVDKSGDIVDFEASREAFANWGGNIREMHSPIAVGKAVSYEPVIIQGEDGTVYNGFKVEAYISKGAEDTWQKVLDGTLRSFSIGGKVVSREESSEKFFRGKPVSIIKEYVLGELSLVDNPANALAIIDIVKINEEGLLKYALDCDLDCQLAKAKQPLKDPKGGLTAAGRRHFKETEGANLKPGVRGAADTPEKMRRKGSFLTRFFTNPSGPMKKPNGEPTRLALSAAAWGEPVPQNMSDAAELAAKGRRLLERYAKTKEKGDFENDFDDSVSFEDALLEQIIDLVKEDDCDCGCGECGEIAKDASVTTANAESKYPSRNGITSPTVPPFPSGSPKFKPKKKMKKEESTCPDGYHQEGEKEDGNGDMVPNCVPDITVKSENQDGEPSAAHILSMLNEIFANTTKSFDYNKTNVENFAILKKENENMELIMQQDTELQLNDTYDKISDMNEQDINRLSLVKKFVNWLVPDVEEKASNTIEVIGNTQEEEMDINVLKDALSAVVDEKLAGFATSIKEEVEASVQEKLETVAKGFEAQNAELQQKLEVAEVALAEQTEKVDAFAAAGAVKKSVDPEDDEEEGEALAKSANVSFWKNTYLPQELINSLGYRS